MYEMDEKCRKCKNNGTAICNRCDMFYDEFDPIDKPKQTNADRIRAMTDEELANLFATSDCHECILDWHDACKSANGECGRERVLYWLKQEASE